MQRNWSGPSEAREVVQLGALAISQRERLIEDKSYSALVRPRKNPILSEYFAQLTGVRQQDLEGAIPFQKLLDQMLALSHGGQLPIFTWGDGDESALRETAEIQGLPFPAELDGFRDIREIFQQLGVEVQNYQSGSVYKSCNLPSPGRAHNALNDVRSMFVTLDFLAGR